MFGIRRRRRGARAVVDSEASGSSSTASPWSDDALFDAIRSTLDEFIGPQGSWELVRRREGAVVDDGIFASMSTFSLARSITGVVLGSRSQAVDQPQTSTVDAEDSTSVDDVAVDDGAASAEVPGEERSVTESGDSDAPVDDAPATGAEPLVDRRLIRPVPREDTDRQVDVELAPIARWTDEQGSSSEDPAAAPDTMAPKSAKNSL